MSLIRCEECGREISDKAQACPTCGAPIEQENMKAIPKTNFGKMPSSKVVKKKQPYGCLIFVLILLLIVTIQLKLGNKDTDVSTKDSQSNNTSTSKEDSEAYYLELDNKSWEQFVTLFKSHNSFISAIDAYSKNEISSLEFYNYTKEVKEYFRDVSTRFNYGKTEDAKTYLSVFESLALSDQQAAQYLIKYIDEDKTSLLSKAQEEIKSAEDAFLMIGDNRGKLLAKAGLSKEEITEKVEEDMKDLEE